MPYASEKQRRFLKWKHPEIDAKWKAEGHDYVRKSMRLSEISKAVTPETRRENDRKAVARGVGTVAIGGGLVAGGVPGMKVNSAALSDVRPKKGTPAKPAKVRAKSAWESGRGGILGYRDAAHANFVDRQAKVVAQHGAGWKDRAGHYARGLEQGRVAPEEKIIGHLRRGRAVAGGALVGGIGLHVYGKKNKGEKVRKALARRTSEQRSENRRQKSVGITATGGALAAGSYGAARLVESQGNKWNARAKANYKQAKKIAPALGGTSPKDSTSRVPGVRPIRSDESILAEHHNQHSWDHAPETKIEAAGKKRGAAAQERYIGSVYGKHGPLFRKYGVGTGAAIAGLGGSALLLRHSREKRERAKAGGPVMKGEIVGFGKNWSADAVPFAKAYSLRHGSNIREYAHLPENIREDVGYGSIGTRRNPMSALDLFASSRIMAATRAQGRIGRRRLNAQAQREMGFAGSRAMLYSPTGRGSVF
jgi:hypothetical protein